MPRTLDPRIVILEIDEKSLLERERGGEGRWPWSRDRLAILLEKLLAHYKVAVVGFDVVFSERDESSGIRLLDKLHPHLQNVPQFQQVLETIKPQLDYDDLFARRMRDGPVVLGYTFLAEPARKGTLPRPILTAAALPAGRAAFMTFSGYTANLPVLQTSAAAAGHFNPLPDEDGVTRRVPMLVEYAGSYYEPLALAMVRYVYGFPPVKPIVDGFAGGYGRLDSLLIGSYRIPLDRNGAALVPYRGPRGTFAYYSLVDVLNERIPVSKLRGKIALIGATAPGLLDLRATPVDPVYPGVEIHANLIAGILDGDIKQKPPFAMGAEFLLVLLFGAAMALWLPFLNPKRAMLVSLSALGVALATNLALFQYAHWVLPLATLLATILLVSAFNMTYGFFVEARDRRQITGLFGQYVPPEVVSEMVRETAKDPSRFSMEGESRDMSVLFTDIRGFTSIAERLEPRILSQLMNEILTPLSEVIYRQRGTIDKYMGDCIMAFWGAPVSDPHHARNAVHAALEMQRILKDLQPDFVAKGWPEIRIGIGVNSGRMSVGNMGSRVRLAYTVMGDAVNVASRLEGITKEYGVDIIAGEDTKNAVGDVVFRQIDRVRVKGKDAAINIFQPLGWANGMPASILEEAMLFHEALQLYRRQEWDSAEERLLRLKGTSPEDRLYDVFLERIAILRRHPPADCWDGVFAFDRK